MVRIFISLPDTPKAAMPALAPEADVAEDKTAPPTLEDIHSNLVRLSGVEATLFDPVWLARYRTSHRYVNRFREGNAFVAGDAAHIHVPLGGQGMNTGIQDGFNLAWKLAYVLKGWARPELLDTYNVERQPVAKALIEGTDRGYTTILHPSELAQNLVRRFGPFVMQQTTLQTRLQNVLEELNVAYLQTPLAEDGGGSRGPVPGERAPDAVAVRLSDCATVRLFELLRGTHWLLLLFGGEQVTVRDLTLLVQLQQHVNDRFGARVHAYLVVTEKVTATAPERTLVDHEHFLHDSYGVHSPCLYLIRPDDYVGFRGNIGDEARLFAYLNRLLIAPQGTGA